MRRLVVASALLATLLFGSLGAFVARANAADPTLPPGPTDTQRAQAALRFLLSNQKPDGSIDESISETADFIIAAADYGYDPATLTTCGGVGALDYLATASDAAANDAGKTAKAILAAIDAPSDPSNFKGRNLSARLGALYHPATGAFGDGSTFGQSLSILTMHGNPPAKAVEYLLALQDTDGSFNFKAAANATEGDTNSTAIALVALASVGNHGAETKALAWLHTQQLADGGFPYQNSSAFGPPASDPDSDALVIQALIATGQDVAAADWSKGGKNALTDMRTHQSPDGGFVFPGNPKADAFTTSQVISALAGKPYGDPTSIAQGNSFERFDCPSPPDTGRATPPPTPHVTPAANGVTPPPTAYGSTGGQGGSMPLLPLVLASVAGLVALAARRGSKSSRAGR